MNDLAQEKADLAQLKAAHPDGISVYAQLLREAILPKLDELERPLELSGEQEFLNLKNHVKKYFKTIGDTKELVANDRLTSFVAKGWRKHWKLVETQALAFHNQLTKRCLDPATRGQTFINIRAWMRAAESMQMTHRQLARSLQEFLRNDYVETPSDKVTRSMLESIERAEFETEGQGWPVAQGIAQSLTASEEWRYELLPQSEGKSREGLFLPAPDIDKKMQTAMAEYAKSLGDRDSDLMILAMARFAEKAKTPDTKVTISIDELMEALGYSKNRSASGESYKAEDKAAVRERFEALQDGFLSIKKAVKDKKGRSQDIESRVLIIEDRVGQADLDGRIKDWRAVTVRFGAAWAHRLFEPQGRMTALLQIKALEYDAIKERLEKRLLKRLGWFWKLNVNATTTKPRTVQTFIEDDIGDELAGYERSRDAIRLEGAFDRLKRDEQIGAWRYDDGLPSVEEQTQDGALPRGWFDKWIERKIIVEAPESLQMGYLERKKAPAIVNNVIDTAPAKADLGAKVRAFRIARQISGLQAAAMIGIDNGTLSRIEGGKRKPTEKQIKAIEGWMRDMENKPDKLQDAVGK